MPATNSPHALVEIGEVKAAHGVKGWVKVFSYTRPIEQIFSYKNWIIGHQADEYQLEQCDKRPNKGLIAKIQGINDRDDALSLMGKSISVKRSELAELDGEYYWSQLIGLKVFNLKDELLGTVSSMLETGANDVMVVTTRDSEQLIPYAESIVRSVELDAARLVVDWEKDY